MKRRPGVYDQGPVVGVLQSQVGEEPVAGGSRGDGYRRGLLSRWRGRRW